MVLQFAESLGFDLPNSLTGHVELKADLLEGSPGMVEWEQGETLVLAEIVVC